MLVEGEEEARPKTEDDIKNEKEKEDQEDQEEKKDQEEQDDFDIVVVAAPQTLDKTRISGLKIMTILGFKYIQEVNSPPVLYQ